MFYDYSCDDQRKAIMATYTRLELLNRSSYSRSYHSHVWLQTRRSIELTPEHEIEQTRIELELQNEIDAYQREQSL